VQWSEPIRNFDNKAEIPFLQYFFLTLPPEVLLDAVEHTEANGAKAEFLRQDILRFFGLRIAMCLYPLSGRKHCYWNKDVAPDSMQPLMGFGAYLSRERFFEIESKISFVAHEPTDMPVEARDPFHPVRRLVDTFNSHRRGLIRPGPYLTIDEMMSAGKGIDAKYASFGCPGKTYVGRKPQPWGIEFKSVVEGTLGVCLRLELQEAKSGWRGSVGAIMMHLQSLWCFAYSSHGLAVVGCALEMQALVLSL